MPAAAVIPAPVVYAKFVAFKMLVVELYLFGASCVRVIEHCSFNSEKINMFKIHSIIFQQKIENLFL